MSQKIPDTFPLHGRNIFGCIFQAFHYRNQTQKQEKRKDDKVDTENHFTTQYYQGLSLCLYRTHHHQNPHTYEFTYIGIHILSFLILIIYDFHFLKYNSLIYY